MEPGEAGCRSAGRWELCQRRGEEMSWKCSDRGAGTPHSQGRTLLFNVHVRSHERQALGPGLWALLKCEVNISFQSDVTDADAPAFFQYLSQRAFLAKTCICCTFIH